MRSVAGVHSRCTLSLLMIPDKAEITRLPNRSSASRARPGSTTDYLKDPLAMHALKHAIVMCNAD